MDIKVVKRHDKDIALVRSGDIVLTDVQSALDLIATIGFETGCHRIALNKEAISEEFFRLSSRLAGEILQKFVNYGIKFAIVGDFSRYTSKPLKDFMYESNRGSSVFFLATEEEAVDRLSEA
jgi:hypothetical protein